MRKKIMILNDNLWVQILKTVKKLPIDNVNG